MRAPTRTLILGTGALLFASAIALACSDGEAARAPFEAPDSAPDGANLPEASTDDSAPPADAGFERGPFDPADEPVTCASTTARCVKELVAGGSHFCARMNDGTVRCWGDDLEYGSLGAGRSGGGGPKKDDPDAGDGGDAGDAGDGGSKDAGVPSAAKLVTGITNATQISAARGTTCARLDDGRVLCWGQNSDGQLGLSDRGSMDEGRHDLAGPVALTGTATRVDVGQAGACAMLTGGAVWCWGNNERSQLARSGIPEAYVLGPGPATLPGVTAKQLTPASRTSFALTGAGKVVSWGATGGSDGVVSGRMSSISPDPVPNEILGIACVTEIAATASFYGREGEGNVEGIGPIPPPSGHVPNAHACVIHGGLVSCWGKSNRGALCTGFPDNEIEPAPAPIQSKAWAQQIAVGDEITCARLTDGTIQCCGDDARGRLGTGVVGLYSALFVPASAYKGHAVQVATSHRSVCALASDGTVACWGSNRHGELGTLEPDELPHPTPVKVAF